MTVDLSFCRAEFPALKQTVNGNPAVFLDGPGGTQVPQRVIDAVSNYLAFENSNTHGAFSTSRRTDSRLEETRLAMADMLGAEPDEVAFGNNMSSLNFMLSRALGRTLMPGDRVVITDLDHEANRSPWAELVETGAEVVSVKVDLKTCTLDMENLKSQIIPDTRIVAVGYASNAVGTINDVQKVCALAHEVGAIVIVDAVHYAPHGPIDVKKIDCDFLVCSAYKFFGPHVGILYGKKAAFDRVKTYKVAAQSDDSPFKIETGTLNHEGIAGVAPAVDFIASIGERYPELAPADPGMTARRRNVLAGMNAIEAHEAVLAEKIWKTLHSIEGITVYGPDLKAHRTPTFSFTFKNVHAEDVAEFLGERGIFVWDGDFYAMRLVTLLGLHPRGGLVRIGLAPYNTIEEIDRLGAALREFAAQ